MARIAKIENYMRKTFLRLGSLFALIAVALGALGSHALEEAITPEQLDTFEVGVRYQFYHALALLAVGLLLYWRKTSLLQWAGWLFAIGILLFSGSIYLLALRDLLQINVSWVGPITPVGGLLFIVGWALLLLSTYQKNQRSYRQRSKDEA
jgi:uncharacterized membrane protein YgdD (TMEM256/DUF423 family)